jgi:hypothetical protein
MRCDDSALGYEAAHQPSGRNIKTVVAYYSASRSEPYAPNDPLIVEAADVTHLLSLSLLNRYFDKAVSQRKINARHRQRDIEGYAIIGCSKCLEISANLIADISAQRRPVTSNHAAIDITLLHQMPTCIIDDERVGNPALT